MKNKNKKIKINTKINQMLSNEDEDVEKEANIWCENFAQMEVNRGRMLPEELPYVLSYWKRINRRSELKNG